MKFIRHAGSTVLYNTRRYKTIQYIQRSSKLVTHNIKLHWYKTSLVLQLVKKFSNRVYSTLTNNHIIFLCQQCKLPWPTKVIITCLPHNIG